MFHNKEEGNILLDYYGSLLTDRQLNILSEYFVDDLSMAEIAENNNITKSAVSDLINRTLSQLNIYEEKLKMIDQSKKIDILIEKMENDKNIDIKYINELKKINRGYYD